MRECESEKERERARAREIGSRDERGEREREREVLFLSSSRACIAAIMLSHAASCERGCGWIKAGPAQTNPQV